MSTPCPEKTASRSQAWLVRAAENVSIPARCQQMLIARLETEKGQGLPSLVCVEHAQIPIEGILTARGLSPTNLKTSEPPHMMSQGRHDTTKTRDSCAFAMAANFSDEELTIPKATVLGVAEEVTE
jgi:hypothetical protein